MSEADFKRRRDLMTRRLVEQIKNFNKHLLIQVFNYLFFIFIVLPFIIGGVLYLLGSIFSKTVESTDQPFLTKFKDISWDFVLSNSYFHMIIFAVMIVVLSLMLVHFFLTRINFKPSELNLAGFILAKVKINQVINYQNLHKEIEFRSLSYAQFDKVAFSLERLEHIVVEDKGNVETKLIIRKSDW